MSKVEEVARAICPGDADAYVEAAHCRNWEQYRAEAMRAIKALRKPTEAMVGRGYEAMDGYGYVDPKDSWRNMIDEALKDGQGA